VFPASTGGIEGAHNLLHWGLHAALRRAGICKVTLQSLTHYYASTAIEAISAAGGVNLKKLQPLMGHTSFRVAMDTYSRLVPDAKDDLANEFADMAFNAANGISVPIPARTRSKTVATGWEDGVSASTGSTT
jgi:integrase